MDVVGQSSMEWRFEGVPGCLTCGGRAVEKVFSRSIRGVPLTFEQCESCGLIFQNPRLTDAALADYFSSSTFIRDSDAADYDLDDILGYPDYADWEASYMRTAALRLRRIAKFCPPPGTLLEVGGATGWFLEAARDFGYDVRGLDVSRTLAETARTTRGLTVDVGAIEHARLPPSQYDVVCSFGGIACWPDPVRALANIRQTLTPKGVFVLNRSNADGLLARVRGDRYFEYNHASLAIYSDRSFAALLQRAGFRVLYQRTEVQYASVGRILTYLKIKAAAGLARRIGLDALTFPVVACGTVLTVCVPVESTRVDPGR